MHLNRKRTSNPVGCKIMDAWSPMSLEDQIRLAVEQAVPDSTVEVVANGSHFSLKVISPVFEGKKTLEKQRMVYGALKDLMAGSNAPVHAIDHLETLVSKTEDLSLVHDDQSQKKTNHLFQRSRR